MEYKLITHAEPVPVEFPAMMASVLATQSASAAAAAQVHHDVARRIADSSEQALTTLMQAKPGWRAAAGVLRGSFNPRVAEIAGDNRL